MVEEKLTPLGDMLVVEEIKQNCSSFIKSISTMGEMIILFNETMTIP